MVMSAERQIAQAIVFLRALVAHRHMDPPLSVALVVGTAAEPAAWRKEAMEYLTAKHRGVQYSPSTVSLGDQDYDA